MNSKYSIVNEELLVTEEASVLITDLAIQRGYGIFDFFKTLNGKPVFLDDHLDRFYQSLSALRLPLAIERKRLKELLEMLMQKNQMPDSGIRLTLTGGYSPDGFGIAGSANLIITQSPLTVNVSAQKGIKLITHDHQRQLPHVKSLDYMMAIWLQPKITEQHAQDVLYCPGGVVTECPRANFYIVTKDGRVLTAGENILKGIIRKQLLTLTNKFDIQESQFRIEDIYNAKGAFITSTTKNVLPVVQVNDRIIGKGVPDETTLALSAELENLIQHHLQQKTIQYA